jgi:F-type H+-transporting ATPase subunit delta
MKKIKQVKRDARHLFLLCLVDGALDEDRVRRVMRGILGSNRRGYLTLANQFERLVRLDLLRHTAQVESAAPLSTDLRAEVAASLARLYGPSVQTSFAERPELIGGMRIRVASDVYDGTIKAGLAALEQSF